MRSDLLAQQERHGKCTQSGWRRAATSATAPNCTYVGSRHWRAPVAPDVPSLMVGSCAKGVRASLEEHSMAWLESLGSTFREDAYAIFVYWDDDGDRDGTQSALRGWARRNRQVHLVLAPPLRALLAGLPGKLRGDERPSVAVNFLETPGRKDGASASREVASDASVASRAFGARDPSNNCRERCYRRRKQDAGQSAASRGDAPATARVPRLPRRSTPMNSCHR